MLKRIVWLALVLFSSVAVAQEEGAGGSASGAGAAAPAGTAVTAATFVVPGILVAAGFAGNNDGATTTTHH